MAAGRAADRASVAGYSGRSSFDSMAAARAADRASMPGYDLGRGAKGDRVRDLQSTLRSAGFNPGKVDGVFGKRTERALRDYQRSLGLSGRTTARASKDLVGTITAVERTMPGTGNCAKAVNRAIFDTTGVRIYGHANQIKNTIQQAGFREVNLSLEQALKTPGLVLTWDRTNTRAGAKYGHTAITTGDGTTSVSDYVEANTLAATDRMNRQGLHVFERVQ
jgi:peptidoglycan hydrolase-like protein with peptidoglycan-binding domain